MSPTQGQYGFFNNEFTDQRVELNVRVVEIDHAQANASYQIFVPVDGETFVMAVGLHVTEAFAGGTPEVLVGIPTDDDAFLGSTDVDHATLNSFQSSLSAGQANAGGMYFPTPSAIMVTLAASHSAGKAKLHIVQYQTKGNWRKPDL